LPESLAAQTCAECRQKATPGPRQETRWQLEAQVKAAEQELARKNQQLLDNDYVIQQLQLERAQLLFIAKRIHELAESGDLPLLRDWQELGGLKSAIARAEGRQP